MRAWITSDFAWITTGLVVSTFTLGSLAFYSLSGFLPFMADMPVAARVGVSLMAGTIMVARSPSSAIAIVNELRAKGPFTQTVLGVTVVMDMVVISLFALNASVADALFSGLRVSSTFILLLALELSASIAAGLFTGKLLQLILMAGIPRQVKTVGILLTGYGVFLASLWLHHASPALFGITILMEPLLICMVAGFSLANFTRNRVEFLERLTSAGPFVYIAFFTLTGASLGLDTLAGVWPVTLALFCVRCTTIFLGTFFGGIAARAPMAHNRTAWMAYITQAGVGLGLAKEVVVEYPAWGNEFATVIISVIVLNQILGPPLFKRAIKTVNESRTRADRAGRREETRNALIFGLDRQALGLAHMLDTHGWQVTIAALESGDTHLPDSDIPIHPIPDLTPASLELAGAAKAGAIVSLLSDEENYTVCDLAFQRFGTGTLIVRLNQRENFSRFHTLGVLVVEPGSAIVSLMDHFVRAPSAASMLLGMGRHQDVFDLEVRNPDLDGIRLRDLRLPLDCLVLSIRRAGGTRVAHGHARLRLGDVVAVSGSLKGLEEVALRLDVNPAHAMVHVAEKVKNEGLAGAPVAAEVNRIIHQETPLPKDRFDRFAENSLVLDLDRKMGRAEFFKAVSKVLAERLGLPPRELEMKLAEREAEQTTALNAFLAVPHIIIEGQEKFYMLLVRSRAGIRFTEAAPRVHAVFVLAGTRDERQFHLHALSAIARIALDPRFANKWLRAGSPGELRDLIVYANRPRNSNTV